MTDKGIQFVKELTIEYIRQNNMLSCTDRKLESQIDKIAETSQIIHKAVEKNFHNIKFL